MLWREGQPWIEGYTTFNSPTLKPPLNTVYCVHLEYPIWPFFFYREGFKGSKEHILHSDLSSCSTNGEVTVKKKAQPSGRKWVSYFVYCIYYSCAQGQDESRALLCKNHCVLHRVRAGVSSEEPTAKQARESHCRHQAHRRVGNTAVLQNIFSRP